MVRISARHNLRASKESARSEYAFAPGVVHLNHAAFAPINRQGRQALASLLVRRTSLRDGMDVDTETFRLLLDAKRLFGRIIGHPPDRIAFAPNTSYGLNMILWGLGLKRGERILIPEVEFPAVVYAVDRIAAAVGLTVEPLPCPDGYVSEETLQKALRKKTAVLALSWVQYFNGYRYDLRELADLCHVHGCFLLVDAIQGAGAVPMKMQSWNVDVIASGTQKWLLGEAGAGFFAVAKDPIRPVSPPFAGWLGRDWGYRFGDLRRWDQPEYTDGRRWEIGSYPHHAVRLAHAGLSMIAGCGIAEVFRRIERLTKGLADGIKECQHRVLRYPRQINRSGIVTISGPDTKALYIHLRRRKFHLALREGNIRVAPHFYNMEREIDTLVEEIWAFERRTQRGGRGKRLPLPRRRR